MASRPLLSYAQLVRLPNVFTALADIALGALATHALPERWLPFVFLLLTSACLYSAGMVWNDVFDIEQDRRERPFRPLPSGRIARSTAVRLGLFLLVAGVGFAAAAGGTVDETYRSTPLVPAVILVLAILLYDGWLKRTWAGPVAMGTCRFLNILLGLSIVSPAAWPWGWQVALVVGLYIVGVTWLARTEARMSSKTALTGAALVMLGSLLLAVLLPSRLPPGSSSPLFPYLLVVLGFLVGVPVSKAITAPTPRQVQRAVKRSLMGLIVLDAVLASAFVGSPGLLLLLLLLPVLFLGRWLYST